MMFLRGSSPTKYIPLLPSNSSPLVSVAGVTWVQGDEWLIFSFICSLRLSSEELCDWEALSKRKPRGLEQEPV